MKRVSAALIVLLILLAVVALGAVFPTSVATDSDLLVAKNSATTTLSGTINNSVTTFSVVSGAAFASNMAVTIDSEIIFCTTLSTNTFSGCTRGYNGSTAASHSTAATVSGFLIAAHHNLLVAEIEAIENSLLNGFTGPFATLSGGIRKIVMSATTLGLTSDSAICWRNNANWDAGGSALDTCFVRDAAGVVQVNNGSSGTYRDVKLRTLKRSVLTVATLPGSPADGDMVAISDSADGSCATGSGSIRVTCIYNGTSWIAH